MHAPKLLSRTFSVPIAIVRPRPVTIVVVVKRTMHHFTVFVTIFRSGLANFYERLGQS